MANGFLVVDDKAWDKADDWEKLGMIYSTLKSMNTRIASLERWMWVRVAALFAGAVIGGASMMLVVHLFNIKPF
jgi:hypothetical protein